jgi:hypothetical protein
MTIKECVNDKSTEESRCRVGSTRDRGNLVSSGAGPSPLDRGECEMRCDSCFPYKVIKIDKC